MEADERQWSTAQIGYENELTDDGHQYDIITNKSRNNRYWTPSIAKSGEKLQDG